jgi:hypothetical protein
MKGSRMKYIEWIEPTDESCQEVLVNRISAEEAILRMRQANTDVHQICGSDRILLEDFIVCHWAREIDTGPDYGVSGEWAPNPLYFTWWKWWEYAPSSRFHFASTGWVLPADLFWSEYDCETDNDFYYYSPFRKGEIPGAVLKSSPALLVPFSR